MKLFNKNFTLLLFMACAFMSFSPPSIEIAPEDFQKGWKVLGKTTVSGEMDRDQIMVKAKKGTFTRLKLQVKNAPLKMEKMIIHFEKKDKQVVWLRNTIDDGDWSKPVKIKGGKRVIKKVVFWYSQKEEGAEKPEVFLWGKQ